jgi:hypothetical protein
MANHAYVKIRKPLFTKEIIGDLLNNINKVYLKNLMQIKYSFSKEDNKHYWDITIIEKKKEYGYRSMWLNSNKSFEIRHGGGQNFIWWVDNLICNTLVKQFNGTWHDDAFSEKILYNEKINSFEEFIKEMHFYDKYTKQNKELFYRYNVQQQMIFTPPSLRIKTGKKVHMKETEKGLLLYEK